MVLAMQKLPQALLDRLERQYGPVSRDAIIAAFGLSRRPTLRTNTIKATDDEIMAAFREAAIQFERVKQIPHAFAIKNRTGDDLRELPLAKDGKIYLQGLTSMLPPLILDPKPDAAILDLCAAPGSKTSQLAAMMNDRGAIVAYEQDSVRYQKLLNTLRIQGATNVETRMVDATLISHEYPETFDNILADVPCSAEGRINLNEPRSYRYWNEKNIVAHAKLQRRLLRSAVAMLKAGGTLVYSTCTLAPEENEEMIAWLVAEFPVMRPVPIALPFPSRKGPHNEVTILPSKDVEGFFVAKLVKHGP